MCCSHGRLQVRLITEPWEYVLTSHRLAPENPFPAPLHDCWESFLWMIDDGIGSLNIDPGKIAVGGASAGANLAAVIAQKASSIPDQDHKLVSQILVVPVVDNTATIDNNPTWRELQYTASLTAAKMTWYRRHYLPDEGEWANPEASPLMSSHETLSHLPATLILVAELDILRHEGEQYAQKLAEAGVAVDLRLMPGVPHPFIAMDATLTVAREGLDVICRSLIEAFKEVGSVVSDHAGNVLPVPDETV